MSWLAALRDHPERPPALQSHVLTMLALRMDWSTGTGFASTSQLKADAGCEERTVRNATNWARKAAMLVQVRRGHRLGDGRTVASEWRLCGISTGTDMPEDISTGTGINLNRQMEPSQPARSTPPSRPVNHQDLSPSLSAPATDEELLAAAVPGADERDIEGAITNIQIKHFHGEVRSVRAYLKTIIANGDAQALVDEAAAERRRTEMQIAKYGDPFGGPAVPANAVQGEVIDSAPAPRRAKNDAPAALDDLLDRFRRQNGRKPPMETP